MSKKLTYEFVKQYIEEREIECLSTEYKNAHDKLKLKCPEGHIFWMSFNHFKRGIRCSQCAGNKKHTYEQIKQYIESMRHVLLSKEYKNTHTKLEIQCPEGHIFWMSFHGFKYGYRCPECMGSKKHIYNYISEYIGFYDHILLSKEYKNTHTKLEIQCPEGHIFWMSFGVFKKGHRCPECSGVKKKTNQEIIEILQPYENIRENDNSKIEVTCKSCEEWFIPERQQLTNRMLYINGKSNSERLIYCSQNCKDVCSVYGQKIYPKYNKLYLDREVQPELRDMVLERDSYTCQKCGRCKDDLSKSNILLHCHHIWPLNESPVTSADIDECETLCADCHIWKHQNIPGCGYGEMRCSY